MTTASRLLGIVAQLASLTILVSCSTAETEKERIKREQEHRDFFARKAEESREQTRKIKERFTPKESTPEEKAIISERSRAYYEGVVASILSLDDGVSPASTIARAAVSENLELLRAWKRAQLAPFVGTPGGESVVRRAIAALPGSSFIDSATTAVLRIRRAKP